MITLPFILVFSILAYKYSKIIRKYDRYIYIATLLFAVMAFVLKQAPIFKPINQGYIGISLFYIVMITGALPKKSKLRIELSKIRKEYSIIGFIIVTPHAVKYLIQYIYGEINIPLYGIIVFVLMIPLFITSFSFIRKKFKYTTWKKLQSFSYLVYIGLFIHLINISDTIERINFVLYLILFITYFVMKITYEIKRRIQNEKSIK